MFICAGRSAAANREGCWNEACVCLLNSHSQTHAHATIAKLQAAIQRIDALQRQGKYDQVAKECAKWLPQIDPDDFMFLYFHITQEEALSRLGRYDETIAVLTRAIGRMPTSSSLTGTLAKLYDLRAGIWSKKGNHGRALSDMDESIRLAPTTTSYQVRADYRARAGDRDGALADYVLGISHADDGTKRAIAYLARSNFFSDDLDRNLTDIEEALKQDPNNLDAYSYRANAWVRRGEFDRAIADFNTVLAKNPKAEFALANRGDVWRLKGDLDRALADQNVAIALHRGSWVGYLRCGDTFRYRGEFNLALADYETANKLLGKQSIAAIAGIGLTHEKMGNLSRVVSSYEAAVRVGAGSKQSDLEKSNLETAEARLAALRSGAPQPVIPPVPAKAATPLSVPLRRWSSLICPLWQGANGHETRPAGTHWATCRAGDRKFCIS